MNDLFLRACRREPVERPPVWMMRQAGRYLPEYRAVRDRADFLTMVGTPELATEITLQPVELLGVDVAILFSDILTVPQAMGMELRMDEATGPRFPSPLRTRHDIDRLRAVSPEEGLPHVLEAIRLTKRALGGRVPLLGFAGAPWTLASYMIEGAASQTFPHAKRLLAEDPARAHALLSRLANAVGWFLHAQVGAGCQAVQIFESWAGMLGPDDFRAFCLPYLAQTVRIARQAGAPVIVYALGAGWAMEEIADETGADVMGIDWHTPATEARRRLAGHEVALQGNFDPSWLFGTPESVRRRTLRMLEDFSGDGYIANLGHGILPQTPVDNVKVFLDTVKEWRASTPLSLDGAAHRRRPDATPAAPRRAPAVAGGGTTAPASRREAALAWMESTHDGITRFLEELDGGGRFREDAWTRPGGGGGVSRVLAEGALFEKAGVNRSAVDGTLPPGMADRLGGRVPPEGAARFFATGVSVVAHPRSPHVPTVHLNVRYFELASADGEVLDAWVGGGTDLTPFYPHPDDAVHFHRGLRDLSGRHGPELYPRFKAWCDKYFSNAHRAGETRGVGGIFFDNLRAGDEGLSMDALFGFARDVGLCLPQVYGPIVQRRRDQPYGQRERDFQLFRRGRYVEFNLVHDWGTLFGLRTNARIESVLMSLPPLAAWHYDPRWEAGSFEHRFTEMLAPRDWAADAHVPLPVPAAMRAA